MKISGVSGTMLLLVLTLSRSIWALSGVAIEAGRDAHELNLGLGRAALWLEVPPLSKSFSSVRIETKAEFMVGYWKNSEELLDVGLTPIFRVRPSRSGNPVTLYFEGAVGFHYLSEIAVGNRILSTNFQFGDHLAIGFLLGRGETFDIAYKFQHLSNASIKRPNNGVNFHILRLVYNFL
jgi:hypothetical protein